MPQVKQSLLSIVKTLVLQLKIVEDVRKLGNTRKISKFGGHTAKCLVSPS